MKNDLTLAINAGTSDTRTTRTIAAQVVIAACLCAAVIRYDYPYVVGMLLGDPETATGIAAPFLACLVAYRWRRPIAKSIGPGSAGGPVLAAISVAAFMATTWPFKYGTVRIASALPMLGGALLSIGGRRFLVTCLPAAAMLIWMVPFGMRYLAALAILPEMWTIRAARMALELLTWADITSVGPDLVWSTGGAAGTIALGEPSRGFSLLSSTLAIGLFVTLASRRRLAGYALLLGSLVPVALACNLLRFVMLGMVTIATESRPESGEPRIIAALCSLISAYVVFCGIAALVGGEDPSAGPRYAVPHRWPRGGWPVAATLTILATAVIVANPVAEGIALRFSKSQVALREPLETLREPSVNGIYRVEINPDEARRFAESDIGTRDTLLRMYTDGSKFYLLFVTYYSNQGETIPHMPEVCYRQSGAVVNSLSTVQLALPPKKSGGEARSVPAELLDIQLDGERRALVYVLCCEGTYHHDRESARIALGMPGKRRTYFSKIESSAILAKGEEFSTAAERARSLLEAAVAELERVHFPTQQQIIE